MRIQIAVVGVIAFLAMHLVSLLQAADTVAWLPEVTQAQAMAAKNRRPLLLFVTSSSCRFCTKMKRESLANQHVAALINGAYVPLMVDADRDGALVQRLRVAAFPTMVVVSADGRVLDRIEGYVRPQPLWQRLANVARRQQANITAASTGG